MKRKVASEDVRKMDIWDLWAKIAECAAELMKRSPSGNSGSPYLATSGEYGTEAMLARLTIRVEHDDIEGEPVVFVDNNTHNDDDIFPGRSGVTISKADFQHIINNHKKEKSIIASALGKAKFKLLVETSNKIYDRGGLTRFFYEQPVTKCSQFAGFTK